MGDFYNKRTRTNKPVQVQQYDKNGIHVLRHKVNVGDPPDPMKDLWEFTLAVDILDGEEIKLEVGSNLNIEDTEVDTVGNNNSRRKVYRYEIRKLSELSEGDRNGDEDIGVTDPPGPTP